MTDNVMLIRRLFDEAWTDGDLEVVDEIVSDDFVFDRSGRVQTGGPALYRDLIRYSRDVFPDMAFEIDDMIVSSAGDEVAVRWTMTGTHEGEYKGVAPTGQEVELEGLEFNTFADGQLVETCTHPNWEAFLESVGVLPLDEA